MIALMSSEPKVIRFKSTADTPSHPSPVKEVITPEPITPEKTIVTEKIKMPSKKAANPLLNLGMMFLVVVMGMITGFGLAKAFAPKQQAAVTKTADQASTGGIKEGDIVGSPDNKNFKDEAQGVLTKGGTSTGEGSHRLMRPGGKSQDVYLTSSIVNLDQFEGAEIKVWGETFSAQKAGWLMDVGRVQVIKLNAPAPYEQTE
jgi:hypothetical protein